MRVFSIDWAAPQMMTWCRILGPFRAIRAWVYGLGFYASCPSPFLGKRLCFGRPGMKHALGHLALLSEGWKSCGIRILIVIESCRRLVGEELAAYQAARARCAHGKRHLLPCMLPVRPEGFSTILAKPRTPVEALRFVAGFQSVPKICTAPDSNLFIHVARIWQDVEICGGGSWQALAVLTGMPHAWPSSPGSWEPERRSSSSRSHPSPPHPPTMLPLGCSHVPGPAGKCTKSRGRR